MPSTRFVAAIVRIALSATAVIALSPVAVAGEAGNAADGAADRPDARQRGNASFYSRHLTGRRTASGDRYDPNALTAAHRTLPLGTKVKVVNPKNERSVVVTVNDRGPVPKNRVIDLSSAAADELGMKKAGVTKVETQVVGRTSAKTERAEPSAPQ